MRCVTCIRVSIGLLLPRVPALDTLARGRYIRFCMTQSSSHSFGDALDCNIRRPPRGSFLRARRASLTTEARLSQRLVASSRAACGLPASSRQHTHTGIGEGLYPTARGNVLVHHAHLPASQVIVHNRCIAPSLSLSFVARSHTLAFTSRLHDPSPIEIRAFVTAPQAPPQAPRERQGSFTPHWRRRLRSRRSPATTAAS